MVIKNIFGVLNKEAYELNVNVIMEISLYCKFYDDLISNFHLAPLFELEAEIKRVWEL
jgi:hypothetical protein